MATVDPATNLTITGPNAGGVSTTINAPTVTPGESVGTYATDLQNALSAAGITATVTSTAAGQLSISGANITTSGSVIQDPVPSANSHRLVDFRFEWKPGEPFHGRYRHHLFRAL